MNNWINVNDRLPELGSKVMVYVDSPDKAWYTVAKSTSNLNGYRSFFIKHATHWQPLPEPPNKESVGNQEDGMIDGISQCGGVQVECWADEARYNIKTDSGEVKLIVNKGMSEAMDMLDPNVKLKVTISHCD